MKRSLLISLSLAFCFCMLFCLSACGEGEKETAHEHTLSEIAEIPATCLDTGTSAITKCLECDYQIGGEQIEAKGHSFQKVSGQPPSCTNEGFTDYERCTACKLEQGKNVLPVVEHSFTTTPAKAATCTDNGHTEIKECSACGYKLGGEPIAARGHTLQSIPSKPASCTEEGHFSYKQCSECDYSVGKEIVPATPHSFIVTVIGLPATCKREGRTMTEQCTVCGYTIGGDAIAKKDHTWKITPQVEPGCTRDGTTAIKTCSFCKLQEGGERIRATGHSYITIPEKPATPQEAGHSSYQQCTVCPYIRGKTITNYVCTDHSYEIVPAKEATPTQAGHNAHKKCKYCDKTVGLLKTVYAFPYLSYLSSPYERLSIFNLTEAEKEDLVNMYAAVMYFDSEFSLLDTSIGKNPSSYYTIFLYTFPEAIMLNTSVGLSKKNGVFSTMKFNYLMPRAEYENKMSILKTAVNSLTSSVKGLPEAQKVRFVFDYLLDNCTYDSSAPNHRNTYGAIVDGRAVCDSFSDGFSLLCTALDVQCGTVIGDTTGSHAWNIALINGAYYYFDATGSSTKVFGNERYLRFGMSDTALTYMGYDLYSYYSSIVFPSPNTLNMPDREVFFVEKGSDLPSLLSVAEKSAIRGVRLLTFYCDDVATLLKVRNNTSDMYAAIRRYYPYARISEGSFGNGHALLITIEH